MSQTIEEYLGQLKSELKGSDAATVQDALSDAEEHLRNAIAGLREAQPQLSEAEAYEQAVEHYGTPAETAAAYAEVERRTGASLRQRAAPGSDSALRRFFGVYDDPRAWGTLLYMLISMVTGIFYFTWVVTGLSLSLSLSLFIFGLPLAILFLLSVRGLALLEGRLVEALLGERMPRRPLFSDRSMKWLERLRLLVTDRHTWLAMLYMVLQMLLGIVYFTLVVTFFSLSLGFMALPVVQSVLHQGLLAVGSRQYFLPIWTFPFVILFGFLLWTVFMHLGRGIGQLHGKYAKALLVTE
jgi:hypothetical protein